MKANQRVLILCEGLTEYFYAQSLQSELPSSLQKSILVEVDYTCHQDPKSLVTEAVRRAKKAKKERNPFNQVWLFFEKGNASNMDEVFDIIDKHGFKAAYSSVCLESWFVLHFEDRELIFESKEEAIKYLKTYLPEYHPTKINPYPYLKESLPVAIQRAKTIQKKLSTEIGLNDNNPSDSVLELIEFFVSLNPNGVLPNEHQNKKII